MSFNTALSGMQAASNNLDVIGNNVANSSTTGFKSSRAQFADVYAASAQGTAGNSIGTGVVLDSVSQQFTQGNISFTENNLDLAINGQGFFILSDQGSTVYSRAGAFGVNESGYVSNSSGQILNGFLADTSGKITGAQGDLRISTSNLAPKSTDTISVAMNLNSQATPPASAFQTGFTPLNPPSPTSYTNSASTTIYDSLGNSHVLTTYMVKAPQVNQWRAYIGIDGTDVTMAAATPPGGSPPQTYSASSDAAPYTLVFSGAGAYIPNNTSAPPVYYGPGPTLTNASVLTTAGTLPTLALGDLTLNGVAVTSGELNFDVYSTSDNAASAITIAAAINESTSLHGVTALPQSTVLDLGNLTAAATDTLVSGNLTINGRSIIGTVTDAADLLGLINAQTSYTGVVATNPSGTDIHLTAADGRNIEVKTNGSSATVTLANFSLSGGSALDEVLRGQVSLSIPNHEAIIVGGSNPAVAGLGAGPQSGIIYTNSDVISITGWNPGTGALFPQNLTIDLSNSTQYGAPFSVQALAQNGYSTGQLSTVEVDSTGILIAQYSNGQSMSLGQVALANFADVQGLQPVGNCSWVETFASGAALVGAPATSNLGVVQSGALEDSNVTITNELVSLITAQRDFQSNAQTIRTEDAITQTIINLR